MDLALAREDVARYARLMWRRGLVTALGGNISVRVGDLVVITPTRRPKPLLKPCEIAVMRLDGGVVEGVPSSEWRMHVAIYSARDDVSAIVHAHPVEVVAAAEKADLNELFPYLSEARAYLNCVGYADYAEPGTWELANAVAEAVKRCDAVVMRRHGAVAVGRSLAEAFNRLEVLVDLARLYAALRV